MSLHTPITLAFAGPAEVSQENVRALLNDFLGYGSEDADGYPEPTERDVHVILPVSKDFDTEGFQEILNWTEYVDLPVVAVTDKAGAKTYAEFLSDSQAVEEAFTVGNPAAKVISLLQEAEGEKYLVILWGEDGEGDEATENLVDLASAADIPIKDLAAGLDDVKINFEDDATPEPEPEPAPEPRRRRGRAAAEPEALVQEEEPLTEDPHAAAKAEGKAFKEKVEQAKAEVAAALPAARVQEAADLEAQVAAAHRALASEPVATLNGRVVEQSLLDLVDGTLQAVFSLLSLEDQAAAARNLNEPYERPITVAVREALEALGGALPASQTEEVAPAADEPAEAPKRGRGRPATNPNHGKIAFAREDDGGTLVKKGRGRLRRGWTLVNMTLDEAIEQGYNPDAEDSEA